MSSFPKNFYFGAATAAHQVEGGNHNDWTEWEIKNAARLAADAAKKQWPDFILHSPAGGPNPLQKENYVSGRACDHYHRFREDFDIARTLGHNAHRFSIEWSRIEPEEGKFDDVEIEHYRQVVRALRERGLEPFVTLWHWTLPLWICNKGGWENKKTIDYFLRYTEKIVDAFGKEINFWLVVNEPNVYTGMSYVQGDFPPCVKSLWRANNVLRNLIEANRQAYVLIHQKLGREVRVGSAHNLIAHLPYNKNSLLDRFSSRLLNYIRNFRSFCWARGYQDFIGINYYHLEKIQFVLFGERRWYFFRTYVNQNNATDMHWEIYQDGLHKFLLEVKKYKLPIYITENGIADVRDAKRADFIKSHIAAMKRAMDEGVDVRGYFYWSLLDNFEWDKGFWPRFGLVEIDYKTLERRIRPSAWEYKKIIDASTKEIRFV